MRKVFLFLMAFGLLLGSLDARAQESGVGIPADVYYLMPSFGQGYIFFRGQAPAQGQLNICAADNTLRFLDKGGKELVATAADNILKVVIDTVTFLRHEDVFYRLAPVTPAMGIAVRRNVRILRDVKQAGYGTTSQTSSIQNYSTIYSDGAVYTLESDKEYPYEASETLFLYKGDTVSPFTKKNLRKLFPARKEQIDAYFQEGHSLPDTLPEALSLLRQWAD